MGRFGSIHGIHFWMMDLEMESWAVSDFVDMIEKSLPGMLEAEAQRIDERFGDDPEAMGHVVAHFKGRLEDGITSRYFGSAILLATWAFFEMYVLRLAEFVAKRTKTKLEIKDLAGGFLGKSTRFFDVVEWPLFERESDREFIDELYAVRNAFAHASGVLAQVGSPAQRARLEAISRKWSPDVAIEDGILVITVEGTKARWKSVLTLTRELETRVQRTWPVDPPVDATEPGTP